uniref:Uncharacterized protein n=1 Tax=Meloidogyne enterolobii TaxID=390850 RepID=A0A6V7XX99_MELEN|nr:unnamed protein product [Meloidogyne enterolobii]
MDGYFLNLNSEENFVGNKFCDFNNVEDCDDNSLYCEFCQHAGCDFIRKLDNPIFQLKITLLYLKFNLTLIQIKKEIFEEIPSENKLIKLNDLNKIFDKLEDEKELIVLKENIEINNLIEEKEEKEIFKFLFSILEHWATKHFVYGNRFGFLNELNLKIFIWQIIKINENKSLVVLLESFFENYLNKFRFVGSNLFKLNSVIVRFVPLTPFSFLKLLKNGQSVLGYRTRRAVSDDTKINFRS